MKYTDCDIDMFRKKLIYYYGSATPFFQIATADIIRVEQMSDEDVVEEAKRLRIL